MNPLRFCLYTYKTFWKKEKTLAFFHFLSFLLIFITMLLFFGHSVKDCSIIFCVKDGMYGWLCLSILIGFFIVWLQSMEERKEDFSVLHSLGVKKSTLVWSLQMESFLFQIGSGIAALLFVSIFIVLMDEYNFFMLCLCTARLQLELQIILAIVTAIYMRKR